MKNKFYNLENKLSKNYFLILMSFIIGSIIYKIILFPLEIPIVLDALDYYFFAIDINISKSIPLDYSPVKVGWPFFLSIIFNFIPSEDPHLFMVIQKISTITISSLTAVPIYFLCKIFFSKKLSLIAPIIFIFDPRVSVNSSLGVADPLFVILLVMSMVLFLNKKEFFVYLSFLTVGFASVVRPEGLCLFISMSVMYFIKYRKAGIKNTKFIICLVVFFIVLLPISIYQENIHGSDLLFDRLQLTANYHYLNTESSDKNETGIPFIIRGLENFPKFLIWGLIPNLIFLAPIGLILSIKKIDFQKFFLIFTGFFLTLPIFYAYSIPLEDTRYLLTLFPILCIWSIFSIKLLYEKFGIPISILTFLIICSSVIFIIISVPIEEELELVQISNDITSNTYVVNKFYPYTKYFESAQIPKTIKVLKEYVNEREIGETLRETLPRKEKKIIFSDIDSIEQLIKQTKENEITHLLIFEDNSSKILSDIYENDKKYSFLKKINYENQYKKISFKIFLINYEDFSINYN